MIALKLAFRNLTGAGIRTWLNVIVLSFAFVVVIWNQGLLEGWDRQASRDTIDWEIGGGQYWHPAYDPYDAFTIEESHGIPPQNLQDAIKTGECMPMLIVQGSIYPEGRMQNVLLRGIDPDQQILKIPSHYLATHISEIPAIVGTRMAESSRLKINDIVTLRWRDVNGMFDAGDVKIVQMMKTNVVSIDKGMMYIPLEILRQMMHMPGEATLVVTDKKISFAVGTEGWQFKDQDELLRELKEIIKAKGVGRDVMFVILMALAMLAIFDTQVLSIFKRHKEIGTLIALGMTRGQVIRLFTIEGAMHGIFAAIVAAIYGIPLLGYLAVKGFTIPSGMKDSVGLALADRIFPVYSAGLVFGTTFLVLVTVTIVSFLPTRRIAKLNPTEAIRGKIT